MISRQAARLGKRCTRISRSIATATPIIVATSKFSSVPQWHIPSTSRCCRRYMSTPAPQVNNSDLSVEKYHLYSDTTMDQLLEALEELIDDIGSPDYEVEYSSGVLTLKLGDKGTYVINKQPPNKQIWLSSPFSGPKRYDYSEALDEWVYLRDGRALGDLLNTELSKALEREVDVGVKDVSQQARSS